MGAKNPKSVRRRIMLTLYDRYFKDPLDMLSPEDLMEGGAIVREDLVPNAYYLSDRGLVELMIGYNPPLFAAVRITADGIDLVENHYAFNMRFPMDLEEAVETLNELPLLVERLVEEADLSALDGEARASLIRDVQYLRDEFARPIRRWRREVIDTVMEWIARPFDNADEALPSLAKIRALLEEETEG